MNYLAHFYLSSNVEGLLIGNFIADFVKGRDYRNYPENIQQGILMHREIDSFTDQHPVVRETKQRLYPSYHKYASVIVDMYYDHILAINWMKYDERSLADYATETYQTLHANNSHIPEKALNMLAYMSRQDWLSQYATLSGIESALTGMSRRTRFQSNMELAAHDLRRDLNLIQKEFDRFFPDLQERIQPYLT